MMGRLDSKTAVVTGGSSGIGYAAARAFHAEGAEVWLTGRNDDSITEAAHRIGSGAHAVAADAGSMGGIDVIFDTVASATEKLDVLLLSAAKVTMDADLASTTPEQFDEIFNVNVRAAFFAAQRALPLMRPGGSIIVTGSIASRRGIPGQGAYAASKAALQSLAQTWAVELAGRGLRVNCLVPGVIDSGASTKAPQKVRDFVTSKIPLGRYGRPEELASAALFLASDESSFVTGSLLTVDGGVTLSP